MLTYTGKTLVIPKYIKEVKIGWYFSRGVLGTGKQIKKVVVKNPKTKIPKKGYGFEDLNIKIIRRS